VDAALKALAEPRRREILRLVWSQERPATERRDGTRRLYLARQDEMKKLRDFLDDYWTRGLERLRDVAEAAQRDKEKS
jgi:hypothetical protein